jgi:predicted permease
MLTNIGLVATQVFTLFILMTVGFICNKVKFLNKDTIAQMTQFVLYIVTPCVIINSFSRNFEKEALKGLLITFGVSFLSFAINILMANLLIHEKQEIRRRIFRYGCVFSNAGFMAIPLQQAILGDEGVFFGAIYVAVFNIMNWTYGIYIMSGDKKIISAKKIVFNPGIIGTVIGLIVFLLPAEMPKLVSLPIEYMTALNTPIPMVIIGYHLADSHFNIKGIMPYLAIIYRLLISPVLIMGALYLLGVERMIILAFAIAHSAPFAATNTMFSAKFGGDTELSAALVSLTTLLSIITMPVIIGIAMYL